MVTDIVQTSLGAFDGAEFSRISQCPKCSGPVMGYDTRQKRFAVIREQENERTITVKVKRFICKKCGCLCNADEPFYPDTRIGSPVIDLFFALCTTLPKSRAARVMETMGVMVDRTTWRKYHREKFPDVPTADVFGMWLPYSFLSLSSLAALTPEGCRIEGAEALAACGFPSAHRAAPHLAATGEKRKKRDEEEEEEERQPHQPKYPGQDRRAGKQDQA
jgi:hypothetical protein